MIFHIKKEIPMRLDKQLVLKRLRYITEKSYPFFKFWTSIGTTRQKFTGQISEDSFQISRILGSQNSFNPLINGQFISYENHTKLFLDIELNPVNKAFTIALGLFFVFIPILGISFLLFFSLFYRKIIMYIGLFPIGYLIILGIGLWSFNSISKESISILHSVCNRK